MARILAREPLLFTGSGGEPVHAPMVLARVAGVEARFVLDTGSEVHLLTKEHADLAGLELAPGEEGMDHSGAVFPSWAAPEVTLELADTDLALRDSVVIPAPRPFLDGGIGGGLSPQHLHPTARVVIDMVADELLLVEADDDALVDFLESRHEALTTLVLERVPGFTTVVVPLAVQGFDEIPTILNTGGKRTEFARAVVPGLARGDEGSLGAGVSGAAVPGFETGEQTLVVGGHRVPVAALAVRESVPDPPGLVGMDVLRATVLACAADVGRRVVWQVEPQRT